MIAPAMNTRIDDSLPYRDLARQRARVQRQVSVKDLHRLAAIVPEQSEYPDKKVTESPALPGHPPGLVPGQIDVSLEFHTDAYDDVWISGRASGAFVMTCHRCAEAVEHTLALNIRVCVTDDEARATELGETRDVLVASSDSLDVAAIVEDEILLSLPDRLCRQTPCEQAPDLHYPVGPEVDAAKPVHGKMPELEERKTSDEPRGASGETGSTDRENPFKVLADYDFDRD